MKERYWGIRYGYDRTFLTKPLAVDHFDLLQIGEICIETGFDIAAHAQVCHEISYIIAGQGRFEQDGTAVEVQAGDVVITPCTGHHRILADGDDGLFYAYIGFRFHADDAALPDDLLRFFDTPQQRRCRDTQNLYPAFVACMNEFSREAPAEPLMVEAALLQLLFGSLRAMAAEPSGGRLLGDDPGQLIHHIRRYVDLHIEQPLTVSGIATALGYSISYLSHRFRDKTGRTLQSYIAERKIYRAKELMTHTAKSLNQIAVQLGYPNLQSFSRTFLRCTGRSPSDYRRTAVTAPSDNR